MSAATVISIASVAIALASFIVNYGLGPIPEGPAGTR